MILSHPRVLTAYPSSNNTLGLGHLRPLSFPLIIDISQIKISVFAILSKIVPAISGVPTVFFVSLSTAIVKPASNPNLSFLIAFSMQFSINDLLSLLGKSDCQE